MDEFSKALLQAGTTMVNNLVLTRYRDLGMSNEELIVFLQYKRSLDRGIDFPDAQAVADVMGTTTAAVYMHLDSLLKKKLLLIESTTDSSGKLRDRYDFTPLYDHLAGLTQHLSGAAATSAAVAAPKSTSAREDVFNRIEVEFGRPLSPTELQTIARWFDEDHFKPELILLALREAVLNQAYSLRYIDRILLNWRQKNITSAGQVERDLAERRQQRSTPAKAKPTTSGPTIPLFKVSEPAPDSQ
ncbi:DnaD domain-containing protein [Furfurilactobacillus entadae]|uniref:DnaD domain-containing protein n=1 Tax=Furfurilactobacillus entadae TaxID=2922307 RepID=UPI0035F09C47